MVLRKELQELAQALKATQEYTEMANLRRSIMRNPALGRQMQSFEREHTRILNLEQSEAEAVGKLEKLYAQYKSFIDHQDVKTYVKATESYQNMVAENIKFLNGLLEI